MSRPLMFDMPAEVVIRFRVTRSQWRDLERVAVANNTNPSGVIREAVNTFVADYQDGPSVFRPTKQDATP